MIANFPVLPDSSNPMPDMSAEPKPLTDPVAWLAWMAARQAEAVKAYDSWSKQAERGIGAP